MSRFRMLATVSLAALTACQRTATNPARTRSEVPTASEASSASRAQQALDKLDTRVPVPLLPMMANHQKQNMRDHLLVVQEILLALGGDDFAGVERAAARMGYSEQMNQVCAHMGAGAPGFTEQSLKFHHTADTVASAAREHDRVGVLRALGATLQSCTGCHAVFKQSVVDESTWNRLTSMAAPSGHVGH